MAEFERPKLSPQATYDTFVGAYVPYLTPETFSYSGSTEEREIVEASIKEVQVRKNVEALEQQFKLDIDIGGM